MGSESRSNSRFRYSAKHTPTDQDVLDEMLVTYRREIDRGAEAMIGAFRELTPTKGLRLCPARKVPWQECKTTHAKPYYEGYKFCVNCGGKID